MRQFDAVVVGGGPGGYECAIRLSQNGRKTALVEEAELGGTCLNRGCIPTKTLLHSADIYYEAKTGANVGVLTGEVSFDYESIIHRKNIVAKQLSDGVAFLEKNHGVTVFPHHAVFTDPHTVTLDNGETLQCENLVIATGSQPSRVPIPGVDLPGVVDSTGLLNMTTCPKHIIIVGGGVIGIEFATFYYRLGVKVTVIEMLDRVLTPFDKDITKLVEAELKKNDVDLLVSTRVDSIEDGLKVHYSSTKDETSGTIEGDIVLMAGGRAPNTRNIGLEEIGVNMNNRGGVEIDDFCQTSVPHVYAIGDVNGKMQLAHVASAQGVMVADHIAGKTPKQINLLHVPSCVYCNPETAMVGLTEDEARAVNENTSSGIFSLAGNGKALTMGENKGMIKFVFDKVTDEILGFHAIGPRATDLAAEVALAMELGATISSIGNTVHPHPTVSEAVMEAAHVCHNRCVNAPKVRDRK